MTFRLILPILLLAALLAAPAAAQASPHYRVGLGDQNPAMFSNSNFRALGIKRVRYIVPWNTHRDLRQALEVKAYMDAARAAGVEVLVAFSARRGCFNGRYSRRASCRAPGTRAFTSAFRAFRRSFPYVRTYSPWNEANHVSQPTHRKPHLAARYYNVVRARCGGCKIVALDLLDSSNMRGYARSFLRRAKGTPKVFGLHNYADVNRRRTTATRALLRTVRGEVWLTETGGIVAFNPAFPYSESRAASRTHQMFRLADAYDTRRRGMRSRITRLYPYAFTGSPRGARFDAGLVDPDGSARRAYTVFKRYVRGRRK